MVSAGDPVAPGAPLVLLLELVVLYTAGSCAMRGLLALSGRGGVPGRAAFYLLVLPGVVLHEFAHYLACRLTGTKVFRFAPFSPGRTGDGRLVLGYVRHERRAFPIAAAVGLAPVLLNPLGILLLTAALTPVTLGELAGPTAGILVERTTGFFGDAPLLAVLWTYLALSFALGSVPSREDLSGLPLMLLLLGVATLLAGILGSGHGGTPFEEGALPAIYDLCALAAALYALPATAAAAAALATTVLRRAAHL